MKCANRLADGTVPFVSTCPQCLRQRMQQMYTRHVLGGFLRSDRAIQAYCAGCEELWSISPRERAALLRLLQVLDVVHGASPQLH